MITVKIISLFVIFVSIILAQLLSYLFRNTKIQKEEKLMSMVDVVYGAFIALVFVYWLSSAYTPK